MIQLTSRWAKDVDKDHALPEYPRPNLVRESYFNLNGEWEYCISHSTHTEHYDGTILVPFSPETLLSGVQKIVQPEDYLHYRKLFRLPEGFVKGRVLLHFGAVDQECEVFLNKKRLGGHKGGYVSFSFDITDALSEGDNVLTLRVTDKTEKSPHARGKQKLVKRGKYGSLFYTPQSGIWKTVWIESVPKQYVRALKIMPLFDEEAVAVTVFGNTPGEGRSAAGVHVPEDGSGGCAAGGHDFDGCAAGGSDFDGRVSITVLDQGKAVAKAEASAGRRVRIPLPGFTSWSPKNPHLYDLRISYGEDQVSSYFGMRKYSVGRDKEGILRFFLNNKPYFFNGVLDQGYWPESLLTPPTDEALKYDIIKLKEYGYNTIRKHIKVEPERFYYHGDRLGMAVWQDMPNGGGDYNLVFVTYLTNAFDWFARGVKDCHYRLFKREDKEGRRQYYKDLKGMIRELYNYPCIAVWVPFNEGWGQFDARRATKLIRRLDPSRLINEACGWFDQKGGDMYSIHNYVHKLAVEPQPDRVVALTEYGGYAYPMEGHLACEKEFGYQNYRSKEELTANYKRLWEEEILPNVEHGLSSAIYTQTSDIEEEINGVMTYDRDEDKLLSDEVGKLNERLYELFREAAGEEADA